MGQQQSHSKDELLFHEVRDNNVEGIKTLHHEGAGLEWVDKEGRTPLIYACTYSELYDVAETLLELGSNVNAYSSGRNGGTSLHHAAKRGLENTVKLLLSHGANPLVLNDDSLTPLKVARAKGYSNVVRAIESHICLFSGWMHEFYGPRFLEFFAPELLSISRRVWVVVVPTGSRNPTKPLKLELAVYDSLQDAQPRTVMALWKAKLEEPKSYQSNASVMIVDDSSSTRRKRARRTYLSQARSCVQVDRQLRLKLAAAMKGDMKQMNRFCDACKGIPQPMNPPKFLQTTTSAPLSPLESEMNEKPMLNHHALMTTPGFISQELMPSVLPLRAVAEVENSPIHLSSNRENKGEGMCVICVDASSEAVCVPCGHVAGCISCLKEIKNKNLGCPICRANIDQVIKLYHV